MMGTELVTDKGLPVLISAQWRNLVRGDRKPALFSLFLLFQQVPMDQGHVVTRKQDGGEGQGPPGTWSHALCTYTAPWKCLYTSVWALAWDITTGKALMGPQTRFQEPSGISLL